VVLRSVAPLPSKVTIDFVRIVEAAERLGGQDSPACPPSNEGCWRHREAQPFFAGEMPEIECRECWLYYFMYGH